MNWWCWLRAWPFCLCAGLPASARDRDGFVSPVLAPGFYAAGCATRPMEVAPAVRSRALPRSGRFNGWGGGVMAAKIGVYLCSGCGIGRFWIRRPAPGC